MQEVKAGSFGDVPGVAGFWRLDNGIDIHADLRLRMEALSLYLIHIRLPRTTSVLRHCLRPDHEINPKGSKHQDRAQERAQSADTGPPGITHTQPAKNLDTLACEDEVNQGQAPARR